MQKAVAPYPYLSINGAYMDKAFLSLRDLTREMLRKNNPNFPVLLVFPRSVLRSSLVIAGLVRNRPSARNRGCRARLWNVGAKAT